MFRTTLFALVFAAAALPVRAQHTHGGAHATAEGIKSLSPEQVAEYLNGDGMGLARAAELNHYPGPKHVLELADSLALSEDQLRRVHAIRGRVVARASELGAAIVEKERELDMVFAMAHADAANVERLTGEIGKLNGSLRAVHLVAHIETRALLSSEQVRRYDQLRGY